MRTKAVGNRHKAKLLGSYNTGDTSKMDRFFSEGLLVYWHERRSNQISLIS